jgi:hypothetical protein
LGVKVIAGGAVAARLDVVPARRAGSARRRGKRNCVAAPWVAPGANPAGTGATVAGVPGLSFGVRASAAPTATPAAASATTVLAVILLTLHTIACGDTYLESQRSKPCDNARMERWVMKGSILGPCNCDWGCPCNFDVAPSYGYCEGVYAYAIDEGRYGSTVFDGLKYVHAGSFPGPVHEGNGSGLLIVDEAASTDQRDALEELWKSGEAGMPFDVWCAVTSTWLDTVVAPIEIEWAGMRSRVSVDGGHLLELVMSRVKNPVTGEDEITYLDKPTGFTSKRTELGTTEVFRLRHAGWDWDYTGKYGEFAEYEYSGPS